MLCAKIGLELSPWISNEPDGKAFTNGGALDDSLYHDHVGEKKMEQFSHAAMRGIIDGGYADNTGVGLVVANGATSVLSVINQASGHSMSEFEMLFKGGPKPHGKPRVSSKIYPMFESPSASRMM